MEPVDFYCERVAAGLGGEPLNAATALAFLGVGLWRLRAAPAAADRHAALALMLLGVAACLHHLFALRLTLRGDVWANVLYLAAFGALLLRRFGGLGPIAILPAFALVVALTEVLGLPAVRAALGRGADTFAVLAVLLGLFALALAGRAPAIARLVALGGLVLAAGLPFRFLDGPLCAAFPLGTHWLWHLANAASIALVLTAVALHARERRPGD